MDFQDVIDRYFTPYYKAQVDKKQIEIEKLVKKYEEINSRLQVRKIYEVEIDAEICCEECNEIIHNHLDECPICKTKFASTSGYSNLDEPGFEENIIQCDECNSYFKLVQNRWYNSPKVVLISEEEVKAENNRNRYIE